MISSSREILHSSLSIEWFTPTTYVDAVRNVFGGQIDLDPASCEAANEVVKATNYYTKETNGLDKEWAGKVFLNPPYSRGGQERWSKKLIEQYKAGNVNEAILLVNAVPDTNWFQRLWAYPICFANKRIKFVSGDGITKKSPTHGSVFVYFGRNPERFRTEFEKFGKIIS